MNVGRNILDIRKSKDLSQEQFGQMFHVTRQTVSNWEKEKSFPDLQTLIDISDQFNVSLDRLIKEDPRLVRTFDRQQKFAKKGLFLICMLIAAFLLTGVVTVLPLLLWGSHPGTPNEARNLSETSAAMYLNLPDQTPSRAIVRTFSKEEYRKFSKGRLAKVIGQVGGQVEGDIPCLHVLPHGENLRQNPKVRPVFQDIDQNNQVPDKTPVIRITACENTVRLPLPEDGTFGGRIKKWQTKLQKDKDGYYFQIANPFGEYDEDGTEIGFVPCLLEVEYEIDGEAYISLSALNL